MNFSDAFLAELKARLVLSAIVGQTVKLRKQGREWIGLSPFSKEKTPSFFVNDEKGVYHCFSSGESGDAIRFVEKTRRVDFTEAVKILAAEAGMSLPAASADSAGSAGRHDGLARIYGLVAEAAKLFAHNLHKPEGAAARDFLRRRRLEPEAWERHKIGFAMQGWSNLLGHFTAKGVPIEQLVAAGLVASSDDGSKNWDRFRNRIIFTITDAKARPIGFGGRAINAEDKPKYINSPETRLFSKGHTLYRYSEAQSARQDSGLILVEGYTDAIAMAEAGFGRAVAPLGTALSDRQLGLLWRGGSEPYICLDGDRAGLAAARRIAVAALPFLAPMRSLQFALLPDGLDPDEFLRQRGGEAMRRILDKPRPLIDMIWGFELEQTSLDTPERRAGLQQRLTQLTERIRDENVRKEYRREIRNRLFDLFSKKRYRPGLGSVRPLAVIPGPTRRAGLVLIGRAMDSPRLLDAVAERLAMADFDDDDINAIRDAVLQLWENGAALDRGAIIELLDQTGKSRASGMLRALPKASPLDPDDAEGKKWIDAVAAFPYQAALEAESECSRTAFAAAANEEIQRDAWDRHRALVAERRRSRLGMRD